MRLLRLHYVLTVMVDSEMTSKIRAFGPGLQGGVVNRPCKFTVETNGERCGL
ncbi:hypothetical protein D917_10253, partial [Trichinella nativa]